MDNIITSPSSDSAMKPKEKKNLRDAFKVQMKINCLSLKAEDDALFNNRPKTPAFVLRPLKTMLKSELDRLSLQQLDYEMDRADLPDDYNFCEIGYCGHPNFPYAHI